MSGQAVFEQLLKQIREATPVPTGKTITLEQFQAWEKQLPFDILKGLRYGQSFCSYFGVNDNILHYELSWINAEAYIKRAYLERS